MYGILYFALYLFVIVNRSMTLYISYKRAWSLKNVTNAQKSLEQSHRRVMIDLAVFTAIFVVAQFFIQLLVKFVFPDLFGVPGFMVWSWFAIFFGTIWIIIETILSIFVLVKLRIRQRSLDGRRSTNDDFEKLIALVALVFCCCLALNVIDKVFDLDAKDCLETCQNRATYLSAIAVVFNSSVNLLIYLLASRNFRVAFFKFVKKLKNVLFCKTN